MREMTNHVTFITNVVFMMLNNSTFIIQWLILFQLKEDVGGYGLEEVILLWGICATIYGVSHIVCHRAYKLPSLIINGKLDSFLVQPKNVLLSVICSETSISAIGDLLYGYLVVAIFYPDPVVLLWFTLFTIMGAITITSFAVLVGSTAFWIVRSEILADNMNGMILHFSTYPDGIFKGVVRILIFTIFPIGVAHYLPIHFINTYDIKLVGIMIGVMMIFVILAAVAFYRGLHRYSSSNLMVARM